MSKKVDERVVEMRFDNAQFEKNVSTSMSTLEKLKKSLNFDGASKSFENIDRAANNVSFDKISSGVEDLKNRFSTMGIVGMRVIENMTDSMISFAKKGVNFVTNSIVQGGKKRAMNLENAHFQLQGLLKDEEAVQAVMKDVNDSVDGTAYSLDAAAKVASQYAATGMRAGDKMYSALRAVAGVAAMTNSEYEDMGRIFTTVAGNGRLMGDQLNQLAARGLNAAATLADYLDTSEAEVRDMVSKGLISFDLFAEAMDYAFGEHAKKANETFTGSLSNVKAALARIGALFISPLVEQNGALVKLFNTLREKINDIKSALIPVADFVTTAVTNITNKVSDFIAAINIKNPFEAIGETRAISKWDALIKKINDAGVSTETFQDELKKTAKEHGIAIDDLIKEYGSLGKVVAAGKLSKNVIVETIKKLADSFTKTSDAVQVTTDGLEHFQEIVKKTIRGDFGNGVDRIKALTKAGEDYSAVQKLVNKVWERTNGTWSDCTITADDLTDVVNNLSDSELKSTGYTDEQVKALRELAKQAEETDVPLNELIANLEKPSAKDLLIDSFRNALQGITSVIRSLKRAWSEVFRSSKNTGALYAIIDAIHTLSEKMVVSEERADKLKRTFKGLFAVLDIIRMFAGGALKFVFKVLKEVLSLFNIEVLDLSANLGDALVQLRDWLKENDLIAKAVEFLAPLIKVVVDATKEAATAVYNWVKNNEKLQRIFKTLSKWFSESSEGIKKWIAKFKEVDNLPKYIIDGLREGLKNGIPTIVKVMFEFGESILNAIKNVLGIHSPSVKFEEIGENSIAGFIKGIQNGAAKAWEALKNFGKKCIETIKNIDLGAVITLAYVGTLLYIVNKIADAAKSFASFAESIGGVADSIKGVFTAISDGITKYVNAKVMETKSEATLNFAKAIGILAASIYILAKLDSGSLWESVGAIAAISAVLAALTFAVSKMNIKDSVKVSGLGFLILSFSASLLILSRAMKDLSSMSWDEIEKGAVSLGILTIFVGALIAAMKLAGPNVEMINATLIKLSFAMVLLSIAIKMISKLNPGELTKGVITVGIFSAFVAGLIWATKLAGKEINDLGKTILEISASILLLVFTIKAISKLEDKDILKGMVVIRAFGGFIVGLMAATRLAGKDLGKIGSTILGIGAAMTLMAFTIRIIAGMDYEEIGKGILVVGAFGAIIAGLIAATRFAGKDLGKVGITILMVSISISILAATAALIGMVKTENLKKGVAVVGLLSLMMMGLIKATKDAKDCMKNLIVMTVAIGIMTGAIVALSFIDPAKLASATLALDSAIGMFALLIYATKSLKGVKSIIGPMLLMTAVIGIIGGIIYALGQLDPNSSLGAAASLSLLLIAMSASLTILSHMMKGIQIKDMLVGILGLTAMAVPLLALVGILKLMSGVDSAIRNATALTMLATALSLLLIPLSAVGALTYFGGLPFIGVAALLAMAIPLLAFVGILKLMSGIENATANAKALIDLTNSIADVLVKISLVAPLAIIGVTAFSALTAVMLAIGGLSIAIGAIMNKFPSLEKFIDKGMPLLSKLAFGIGDIMGSFIGGFGAGIASGLPEMAKSLSDFMTNLLPFIAGALLINENSMKGVKELAKAILIITATEIIQGIGRWIGGGSSMADFAKQLVPLGIAMKAYGVAVSGINSDEIAASANAAKGIAEVAASLPRSGGLAQTILGDKDISEFGIKLVAFGAGLRLYGDQVKNLPIDAISNSAQAGKALADLAESLPKSDGWAQSILGSKDIGNFGSKLEAFGKGLNAYGVQVAELPVDKISESAKVGKALSKLAESLPKSDGWSQTIFGSQDLESFGTRLKSFGESLKAYGDQVANIQVETISNSVEAFKQLVSLAKELTGVDFGGMKKFGKALISINKSGVDNFVNAFSGSADDFKNAGENVVTNLVKGINAKKSVLASAGSNAMDHFSGGITKNLKVVVDKLKWIITNAVAAAKGYYSEFYSAGGYLGEGLVNGINAKKTAVYNAGFALGQNAVQGEKDGQASKSPSKLTIKAGKWLGEGLVIGIKKMYSKVYDSGHSLGETAVDSITTTVSRIADAIDSDIDAQPTIRPVLDLSDVRAGASSISGMFDANPSVGVLSNVRAISSMMNGNQNGGNDDVISAIKDLGNKMSGKSGDTYQINGITYDDGSNVSDAVATLVRAVRVERRR
jgi:tape measure domain-containing protein